MSPFQFRAILVGYVALFALNILLGYLPPRPAAIPKERNLEYMRSKSRLVFQSLSIFLLAVGVIGIIGFVGMFFFWPPALKLFVCATVGKTIIWPFFARGQPGPPANEWQKACSSLEAVLDGVIAAATFIGSARPLFGVP